MSRITREHWRKSRRRKYFWSQACEARIHQYEECVSDGRGPFIRSRETWRRVRWRKRRSLLTPEDIHTCCVRRGVESLRRDDGGVNLTPLSAHDWKTRTLSSWSKQCSTRFQISFWKVDQRIKTKLAKPFSRAKRCNEKRLGQLSKSLFHGVEIWEFSASQILRELNFKVIKTIAITISIQPTSGIEISWNFYTVPPFQQTTIIKSRSCYTS